MRRGNRRNVGLRGTAASEIRQARWRAGGSVLLNMALAVGKGAAGVIGGSSALIGDAIHSATDVIASLAAFFGLWLAGKKHPAFPYGLYRAETVATLIISIAILMAAYEIGRQALLGPTRVPDIGLTLPVAVASLIVSFGFGFYQLRSGRRLHSKALEADARDYLADGLSTSVVVLSLVGTYFGWQLDRWGAAGVSLFVFWSGGHLLWRALRDLMDEAIDRDSEREIIRLVEAHPSVVRVARCMSRTAGGRFIIDLEVDFRYRSMVKVHEQVHHTEDEIKERFPRVLMVGIRAHFEEGDSNE